ncbi:MAG TPA: BamA/TamA family outer membrane protein, partial [Bacteroidales bacterium]|nr:BamA/TamA family outer membrane protein [Bacteroidales bacterium]
MYTGADVKVETNPKVAKKTVRKELENTIRTKPNSSFLGWRPQLWFYYASGENPKGVKKWIKRSLGQPPVYLSSVDPEKVAAVMTSRLESKGYFRSTVNFEVSKKNQKASVVYTAKVTSPYKIGKYDFPAGEDSLSLAIRTKSNERLFKTEDQYDLDLLKQERQRIDADLKKVGYYFFNPDFLLYEADTTAGDKHVDLRLTVKRDIPGKAKIPYFLGRIYINPSYSLNSDSIHYEVDTLIVDGYYYLDDGVFRPKTIIRSVFLKPGAKYDREMYNLTIRRLMGISAFSFANIKFTDTINEEGKGVLNTRILLTQGPAKSITIEPDLVTKSNNYSGPAVSLSFKNRNLLKGAELLLLTVDGNYEIQLNGAGKGYSSYEVGGSVKLYFPRFFLPFRIDQIKGLLVPKTKFEAEIRLIHRMQLFDMANMKFTYGYTWKTSDRDEFEIDAVALNFSKLLSQTAKFDTLIAKNSYLRRSFEEQFTFGSTLSYTHNGLLGIERRNQFYFNATVDLSGNLLSLFQSLVKSYNNTESNPYNLFGFKYSQYSRITSDGRYYFAINKKNRIALRLMAGVGIPYGNSRVMPYLKQFFSGGANSIRAFLPRTIGPGSYTPPDSIKLNSYFDQSGDIKLEANLEYRFPIISVLKGAIFLDAGNVWLMRADTNFPGGEFRTNQFMQQIAVGTGIGLR